ncbi:hypothetical protein BDV28DRAFT_131226 [Aspergillus coremiiformis]|uniref:Uncharacterized protein n=1 Tax=Aspergillus coremiiformis TaxID=138285 RepID=A0A5N6Z9I6_9EURO|nr:hypothetical protein BDV28DRAFT_131226 [Aspergillus coremiiformis]
MLEAKRAAKPLTPSESIPEIQSGLFIGNSRSSHDLSILLNNRISVIISLESVRSRFWNSIAYRAVIPETQHLFIRCVDTSTQDLL